VNSRIVIFVLADRGRYAMRHGKGWRRWWKAGIGLTRARLVKVKGRA
jgi:hypothetical protein